MPSVSRQRQRTRPTSRALLTPDRLPPTGRLEKEWGHFLHCLGLKPTKLFFDVRGGVETESFEVVPLDKLLPLPPADPASGNSFYQKCAADAAAAQPPDRTTYTTPSRDPSTYGNPLWTAKGTYAARVMRDFLKKEDHWGRVRNNARPLGDVVDASAIR